MKYDSKRASDTADREITASRVFEASRDLVWEVWTDPNHVARWWGPNGFTNTIHTMDVKPGGIWEFTMHGPDGVDYPNKISYLEVTRPKRLVYDNSKEGGPGYHHVTVTFEEVRGKTRVTMRMLFKTAEERDRIVEKHNAVEGLNQNMDKLGQYLTTM